MRNLGNQNYIERLRYKSLSSSVFVTIYGQIADLFVVLLEAFTCVVENIVIQRRYPMYGEIVRNLSAAMGFECGKESN